MNINIPKMIDALLQPEIKPMNELERAIANPGNQDLDFYLEIMDTPSIRFHIEEIKRKAADSSEATRKISEIQKILA